MLWGFDDPVPLPNGRSLSTLKDAADYITRASEGWRLKEARQLRCGLS
jgi:hypothetical protein